MDLPRIILHNEISIDGSVLGYDSDMGTYYSIAYRYLPDAHLVGSATVKSASIDLPPEEPSDYAKPVIDPNDKRPYWVIADSKGVLQNLLHFYRRMEYIKGIIVLVSNLTPASYINYLEERNFDIIVSGQEHVNLPEALSEMKSKFGIKTLISDSGGILNSILIQENLAEELSLIISPSLVGQSATNLFRSLSVEKPLKLSIIGSEVLENGYLWVRYALK